jgi:dipeptidyl-peptidase-4
LFFFLIFTLSVTYLSGQNKKDVTLDDLMRNRKFSQSTVQGINSMKDGLFYTTLNDRGVSIVKYSYKTGEKIEDILTITDLKNDKIDNIEEYTFSANESKILFCTNSDYIYRRSFTADYYIYDRTTKTLKSLSDKGKQQVASFSPDGSKIGFVRANNLFYKDLNTDEEVQITTDGEFNKIINGVPDWVYEEEFEFNTAWEWSPDGTKIAFMRFDESDVKLFNMTMFAGMSPEFKENALYPENKTFKYPKAGEDNSILSVHVYTLASKELKTMDVGQEKDQYIPRIHWTNDPNNLSILRLNRMQNNLEILFADPLTGKTRAIYNEKNKYFIHESNFFNLNFLEDNKHFVITSEADGFCHLYLYDMQDTLVRQLTKGNWEVTTYYGYDSESKLFYFQSCQESPIKRGIYSVDFNGKTIKKLSEKSGSNEAQFSTGYKYFINFYNSVSTPNYVTLHEANGKNIRVLEENTKLKKTLEGYNYSVKEFFNFSTSEGIKLNGWMIKPVSFDPNKKYPVLVTQYNGPNSQEVLDDWRFGWEQILIGKGYIVASVDTRGTGSRGQDFCKVTYKQLGKYETTDMIEFAKWLGAQTYIDKERIGVWGWSYGGFMSLLSMTKGADYYKTGIAVAPVTNWRYYDNIYTERFMTKPQDNPSGYDDNSPIFFADRLKGKLLICAGTADDNVHAQNTYEMSERLVQADKQFDMMIYLNRNHSIYGGNTRFHLYTKFIEFLEKNL